MRRRDTVDVSLAGTTLAIVAVTLALLAASVGPVSAVTQTIISEHTTASEFDEGTYTDLTVVGSGEDAALQYSSGGIATNGGESASEFVASGDGTWPLLRDHGETWLPGSTSWQRLFENRISNPTDSPVRLKVRFRHASGSSGNAVESRLLIDGSVERTASTASNSEVEWDVTIPSGEAYTIAVEGRDSDQAGKAKYFEYTGNVLTDDPPRSENGPGIWLDEELGQPASSGEYTSDTHQAGNALEGVTDLNLTNTSATVTWQAKTSGTWSNVTTATYTAGGEKRADLSATDATEWRAKVHFEPTGDLAVGKLERDAVFGETSAPSAELWMPEDGGRLNGTSEHLAANITDPDFISGDNVSVEFFIDGESVATKTLEGPGTAQYAPGEIPGGTHQWYVVATDRYGNEVTSETRSFRSPMILYIHAENGTQLLTQNVTVDMVGTASGSNFVTTRYTEDGTITFGELPDEQLALRLSAEGYETRKMLVDNPYGAVERHTNLLQTNATATYQQCFQLDSRGAGFAPDRTWLIAQQYINESWRDMSGGYFGAANTMCFGLTDGEDYRLSVRDAQDRRNLGGYRGDSAFRDITRNLIVEGQTFGLERGKTFNWEATTTVTNETSGAGEILFKWNSRSEDIEDLHLVIHERGNPSNVLDELTYYGSVGTWNVNVPVPANESDEEWVVAWDAEQYTDGEVATHIDGQDVVALGRDATPLGLSPFWSKAILGGSILLVAGVFGLIHAPIGAVVTAGYTGILYVMGYLAIPESVLMFAIALSVVGFTAARGGR